MLVRQARRNTHPLFVRRDAARSAAPALWLLKPLAQAIALCLVAGSTEAATAFSSSWFAAKGAAQQAAAARPGGGLPGMTPPLAQQQRARQQLERSVQTLNNTVAAIAAQQAAQAAGRAAAFATLQFVPDGMGEGGLKVDTGLTQGWQNAKGPQQSQADGKTAVKIEQTADKAILNWETFNVGRNTSVEFAQQSNWAVLNRVNDPSARPSQIQGQIKGDGTVMLINRNGIVFSGTSQVNVRNLVAAAANITDIQFRDRGLYFDSTGTQPTFTDAAGKVLVERGARIETHKPTLSTDSGGYTLLLGGEVDNAGSISTAKGQTVLGAGDRFYIRKGSGTEGNGVSTTFGSEVIPGFKTGSTGKVSNSGLIQASTGDITLTGHEVVQNGVLLSSTSVSTRGTIHLLNPATDTTGSVTLNQGSVSAIMLDGSDLTALDSQRDAAFTAVNANNRIRSDQSRIDIGSGGTVEFQNGSITIATGGQVAVAAGKRSLVRDGALIDVSGALGVKVAMEANNIKINVQGNEQRDSSLNRESGALNSNDVWVDVRELIHVPAGTNGYATDRWYTTGGLLEVGGYLGTQGHSIGEWMAQGGTVSFSGNDVVTEKGSLINLSGGTLDVQSGNIRQSWLRGADGRLYEVSRAPGDILYTGLYKGYEDHSERWGQTSYFYNPLIGPTRRFESGYTVGRDAGQLVISTSNAVLDGQLLDEVFQGERQNQAPRAGLDGYDQAQTALARRAQLIVGSYDPAWSATTGGLVYEHNAVLDQVRLGGERPVQGNDLDLMSTVSDARKGKLFLDTDVINGFRLGALKVAAKGKIEVNEAVTVDRGGDITLYGQDVQVNADLTARAGSLNLGNPLTQTAKPSQMIVGEGVRLDTRGVWTNLRTDQADANNLAYLNGGLVSIRSTGDIRLGSGSVVDVSSGGAVLANGKTRGGKGGDVKLESSANAAPGQSQMVMGGEVRGYGVTGGGTLTIQANKVLIGQSGGPVADHTLQLAPGLFNTGFSAYNIVGLTTLRVADDTVLDVTMPVYRFGDAASNQPNGVDPQTALELWTPTLFQENPTKGVLTQRGGASLALQAGTSQIDLMDPANSTLTLGQGSRISVDPGQRITLRSAGQITLDGELNAWGGTLDIRQQQFSSIDPATSAQLADPNAHNRSIWIGERAVLDVAGRANTAFDALGRVYGQVGKGGSIIIGGEIDAKKANATSADAYVIVRKGARLEASGAEGVLDIAGQGPTHVVTDGGRITLSSYNGLFIDGNLHAAAGGAGAAGGRLEIALDTPLYHETRGGSDVRVAREMIIGQRPNDSLLPADLQPGETDQLLRYGQTRLSADTLMAGGFDNLSLLSNGLLSFAGDVDLRMNQSLSLYAGSLSLDETSKNTASINLAAPYLRLSGMGDYNAQTGIRPTVLNTPTTRLSAAQFNVSANLLDLNNRLSFGTQGAVKQLNGASTAISRRGFNLVTLDSSGHMRFLAKPDTQAASSVWTAGDMHLRAAQIYPGTGVWSEVRVGYQSDSRIVPESTLRISGHGPAPDAQPYSLFGRLALMGGHIEQGGVIRAPLGLIAMGNESFGATREVHLLPGSVTSVSGAGLVMPYGGTTDGIDYRYNGKSVVLKGIANADTGVFLNAQYVDAQTGSLIDLSGGGDLRGAGFVSGRGGSTDARFNPLVRNASDGTFSLPGLGSNPVYAIVPGNQSVYAPVLAEVGASDPRIGQQMTIGAGVPGLAAGTYTLLPSTFALLPGAFRVEVNGQATPGATNGALKMRNGSWTSSGQMSIANTGLRGSTANQVILTSADVLRRYSQYNETSFTEFVYSDAARRDLPRAMAPMDGKTLNLLFSPGGDREVALNFNGQALFNSAKGGVTGTAVVRGAPSFEILRPGQSKTQDFGGVSLYADSLNNLNAGRLSIGAAPTVYYGSQGNVITFTGTTNDIILREGALLSAPEVLLRTTYRDGGITIESGAGINTLGRGDAPYDSTDGFIHQPGAASLLVISNGWTNVLAPEIGVGTAGAGSIRIGTCASQVCSNPGLLYSNGSITAATDNQFEMSEAVRFGTRHLALAVGAVNAGSAEALAAAGGRVPVGLALNQNVLDRLLQGDTQFGAPALETLSLTTRESFNFFGSVSLDTIDPQTGKSRLDNLVLATPAIYGLGDTNDVATIRTANLIWNGATQDPGAVVTGGAGSGRGTLDIQAQRIEFGYGPNLQPNGLEQNNRLALGFANVNLNASERITSNHKGSLAVYEQQGAYDPIEGYAYSGGNLNLRTPLLTGEAASVNLLTAGNGLTLTSGNGAAVPAVADALGAELTLEARTVSLDSRIALASGKLVIKAEDDLTLARGAYLDMTGRTLAFNDVKKYSWGGDVALYSSNGNIRQAAGSRIDLSAINNQAGNLSAVALAAGAGVVDLRGEILGTSSGYFDAGGTWVPYKAGGLDLRAQHLGGADLSQDFAALNQRLDMGRVFGSRSFQLKQGNLVIGDGLKAGEVNVSVDNGSLTVVGLIDASGERVGNIRLSGKNGLTVAGSAMLDAHGSVLRVDSYGKIIDAPNRAMVELNSGEGLLTLASGARIDLRHGTGAVPGSSAGQHDGRLRGTLELNAPRLGAADIAIDATGAVSIQGARSIGLNAMRRYTDARDGIDPAVSGRPYQVIDQTYLNDIHDDSTPYINAARANADLLQRKLAGLNNATYADAFHLRPGVEIVSKTSDGDLVVEGDLDLSGYRYASLNPHTQKTSVYGSGESGSLVIRAGGNLDIYGSINDGFAPPPETVDDAGWKLVSGVQPFGAPLVVPGTGVTLAEGTLFPAGATLNYDLPIQATTLVSGTLLPTQATLAAPYTFSAGTVLGGSVYDSGGNLLYAVGTLLNDSVTVPANSRLGAGIRLNKATALSAMLWPKGVPLPADNGIGGVRGVKLSGALALLRGSLIPSMTDVVLADGTSMIELRPLSGTQQGKNWAVASMLPSGSASWSMRVVAGADMAAADTGAVKPVTEQGNLRLADTHYGLKVVKEAAKLVWSESNYYGHPPYELVAEEDLSLCDSDPTLCEPMALLTWASDNWLGMPANSPISEGDAWWCDNDPALCMVNNPGITATAHTQMFSVLRTGTGDLDLLASGNLSMDSPFGVYTAGTQSSGIDPRYNQPRGRLSDNDSVLGSAGGDYEKWVDGGSASLFQAWYPELGGNLTISAGGSVSADVVGRRGVGNSDLREQVPSVAVGNWLWRQGTGGEDVPTAWWINFGSYAKQPLSAAGSDAIPYLVGFTGFGTLGGGNISLRVGADGGALSPVGDGQKNLSPRGQGLIVAVGSTGRVASDGSLQLTGGGDMDIRIGATLNPHLQAADQPGREIPQHDLQGALINLRGAASLTGGALGNIALRYGATPETQDPRETRAFDPFNSTAGRATGGLVLIPGDSGMRLNSRGDLVLGGAADPGRVPLQNSTPFTTAQGVIRTGGGLTGFSLWTEHTAIDLFAAGGNLTPSTQMAETYLASEPLGGMNTSPTDGRFVFPSILRAVAGQGSIYAGQSAAQGTGAYGGQGYSLLLAPSRSGQLELLAGDSIYAGGYGITQSGASPAALATPFAPAFYGFDSATSSTPLITNAGSDGVVSDKNTRYPLFAFGPNSYSGLSGVQAPARFYALTGDLVGVRSGETLAFNRNGVLQRTWYEGAGPVWMLAGRDIVASGTYLGQPTDAPNSGMGRNGETITSTGNLFIHNNPNDVSRVSAGRDILYSSFDIGGPGTLEINAGRNILMEDRANITSIGPVMTGDKRSGANLVLQAGVSAQGPDYGRFIARYLHPDNLAVGGPSLSAQPGKVVKIYGEELQAWLTLGYGFRGNEEQARAFFAALPSTEQAVFARQVYFAELRAGGLEYSDESGPRQGSYLRGRNAITALFPTNDVAGNPIGYDGDITLYGGAGIKTLFGGDIQMLTPGGGQVFGVEGAAPPSTAGIVTQGAGNIQLYSKGSILLGQSRIMTTFGGGILGWSAEGDINAGRGSKTTVVFTPPKRVYDSWGNVTLSPTVPSTGAGIATLNPIAEVPPGNIDLIAPLGTIDAGEAGIRSSGDVNIIALQVVNAANIQVQGKSSGIPVTASVNTGAITSASSAATSATQAAEDMSRQQQAASRKNQASVFTVQVLSFGSEQLAPSRDGASRAPSPAYNPDSPVQVLGAGALDESARQRLTEEERGNLTL
ncbi:filamentous haemagglutinin family protein [Pseudomonas sp. HLT2-19-2]